MISSCFPIVEILNETCIALHNKIVMQKISLKTSLPLIKSQRNSCREFLLTIISQKVLELDEVITKSFMQAPFEFSNQLNKQVRNIYNVIISRTQIWHINQSRWLTDSLSCTISLTVNLSQLTLEADPNKIPHKIWFNMSKKHQIKHLPQNSRRGNRVVIMNMGNSIALDLYRFLIQ